MSNKVVGTTETWQIDAGFACAGIVIDTQEQRVIDAAPIFRWMIGKPLKDVWAWRKIVRATRCGGDDAA